MDIEDANQASIIHKYYLDPISELVFMVLVTLKQRWYLLKEPVREVGRSYDFEVRQLSGVSRHGMTTNTFILRAPGIHASAHVCTTLECLYLCLSTKPLCWSDHGN